EPVAQTAQFHDLGLAERLVEVGGQSRPFCTADLPVGRQRLGRIHGSHALHRIRADAGADTAWALRPATLIPCAWEFSTSAPTPSTCLPPRRDPVADRWPRRAIAPSCA